MLLLRRVWLWCLTLALFRYVLPSFLTIMVTQTFILSDEKSINAEVFFFYDNSAWSLRVCSNFQAKPYPLVDNVYLYVDSSTEDCYKCKNECVLTLPEICVLNVLYGIKSQFYFLFNYSKLLRFINDLKWLDLNGSYHDIPACDERVIIEVEPSRVTTVCRSFEFTDDILSCSVITNRSTTTLIPITLLTTDFTTSQYPISQPIKKNYTQTFLTTKPTTTLIPTTLRTTDFTTSQYPTSQPTKKNFTQTFLTTKPTTTLIPTTLRTTDFTTSQYPTSQPTKKNFTQTFLTTKPTTTERTAIVKLTTVPAQGPDIDCKDPSTGLFNIYCNITQGYTILTTENVERVANDTRYFYNGSVMDNNAIYALSVIFFDCAEVINVTHSTVQAMSRLLDQALNTDPEVFLATNTPTFNVSDRLLRGISLMLVNAPLNATYLIGTNFALHVHALDCIHNNAGSISIDADDTFQLTNDHDEMSSIAVNAQSVCSAGATRVHYTIYRNSKLFLGTPDNEMSTGVMEGNGSSGLLGSTTESVEFENMCNQGSFKINGQVLAATAVRHKAENVKVIHQSASTSQMIVKLRFKRNRIGVALHGKLKVAFWETDNHRWSVNTCEVKKDGDYYVSECTHLTDFALFVDGSIKDPLLCSNALAILNNVVAIASIISLTLLTAFYVVVLCAPNELKKTTLSQIADFAPLNSDKDPFLLIQVFLLLIFFFVFVLFSDAERLGSRSACIAVAVIEYLLLMVNSTLAVFQAWRTAKLFTQSMFIERMLIKVTKPLPMYSSVVLLPFLLIFLFWLITGGNFFFRHDGFCWIRTDYIIPAVIIPMTFLVCNALACFGLFTKRMFPQFLTRKIRGEFSITIHNTAIDAKERLARLFISQFTLGVPWVLQYFALFAPTATTWHYLFVIFNGSQGVVLLIALIFRGISVRRQQKSLWRQRHNARLDSLRKN